MAATHASDEAGHAVAVHNRDGRSALVISCDHASANLPEEYAGLGLPASELKRHIAWDIGALGVCEHLSALLDAPLLHTVVSRLLLDVNRDPGAHDSIPLASEDTPIPGNRDLSLEQRAQRQQRFYAPYHDAIAALVRDRLAAGRATALIAVHSFTPEFKGIARPWHVGVLSHLDRRMAEPLLRALREDTGLEVGDNQPYAPSDGVYHTLDRHAEAHGRPCVMIELRNDLIRDAAGQQAWAERLAPLLQHVSEDATAAGGAGAHR